MQFFHGQMTNIAYYRHSQGERLKDLGFDLIPHISSDYHIVSELLFIVTLSIVISAGFAPFLHKNPPVYAAVLWIRCMLVMAMCLIIRCLSFLATSLPGPAAHCQPMSEEYEPPNTIYDILFNLDPTKGCGDLIFSSHTSLSLCLILTFYIYGNPLLPKKLYQAIFYLILLPSEILMIIMIIAARKHYTVDVIVAVYTTPMVYYTSYYFLSDEGISGITEYDSSDTTYDYSIFPLYITEDDKMNAE